MDDIVKQAMAKWPNVPHCYGWLALDARGTWRMRDERGCWYFQNGPQRVYINLEATPFIARTDPAQGLVLHTGQPMAAPDQAFMLDTGGIVVRAGTLLAQLDDRDVAQLLTAMELDGKPAADEALMAWLDNGPGRLSLRWQGREIALERLQASALPQRFGFIQRPDQLAVQN
jgi:hypothetical protein